MGEHLTKHQTQNTDIPKHQTLLYCKADLLSSTAYEERLVEVIPNPSTLPAYPRFSV